MKTKITNELYNAAKAIYDEYSEGVFSHNILWDTLEKAIVDYESELAYEIRNRNPSTLASEDSDTGRYDTGV